MHTILDLFSGCGGLALGSKRAGFKTALAVDIDPILSSSFGINFPKTRFLHADVSTLSTEQLSTLLPNGVDGVIGGPPCQAFSGIGKRLPDDPRRDLVGEFFRIIKTVQPAFFLMENVPGLGFPENLPILEKAIKTLGDRWVIHGPLTLDASDFGAPTKRKRIFVFGFDPAKMNVPSIAEVIASSASRTNVRDAIGDLADIPVSEAAQWAYKDQQEVSCYARKLRSPSGYFTGHQLTRHRAETIKRYANVSQGGIDPVGKHKRLDWNGLCPTLRAGTGSDRGSYQSVRPLHPEHNRVISPREAARLQGFPDDFVFHTTVWHSFRMIGNSVSPIIAETLLTNIRKYLPSKTEEAPTKNSAQQALV
ncbi:DNA cytosine methyltransferase [Pseudomonas sp.]|uniref:DNA cytosine methyltransferase n=1 Tax=Pseudomonas sp. TaxID=306 RepID=UPI0028AF1721|nr:DNA cytosine methyltransferase [Pseudomonas sp.]